MKKVMLIICLPLFFNKCTKDTFEVIYYPLKDGNTWTYIDNNSKNIIEKDTIEKEILLNGVKYFIINYAWGSIDATLKNRGKDTLRYDTKGSIINLINGTENILYDFTLKDGDTYLYNPFAREEIYATHVIVKRNLRVEIGNDIYDNCIELFFRTSAIDAEVWYTFAPNIGLIKIKTVLVEFELKSKTVSF